MWLLLFNNNNMGWKTVIVGSECVVSVSLNRMKISIGEEFQTIPLSDIDTVIFSHNRVVITIPLLAELVDNNINVVICDKKNDPVGVFNAFNGHSLAFKQLNKQINWKITRKKKLWKSIVEQKIQSEIDALKHLKKGNNAIKSLISYKESVYTDDQTNREGVSARVYFQNMFGKDFSRDDDSVINYALNYGYKILASYLSKCIVSRGMLTQLGVHHIGESNPFNLTYDFIEPLRVIIDIWVLTHITDSFDTSDKLELVDILNIRVNLSDKWIRLGDAIEDIVDSYISYMNEETNKILSINVSKGFKESVVR